LNSQTNQGCQTDNLTKEMSIDSGHDFSEMTPLRLDQRSSVLAETTSFPDAGTSSNPTLYITILINNLSIKGPEWMISPSLPPLPPMGTILPSFSPPSSLPPCPSPSPTSYASFLPLKSPAMPSAPISEDSTTSLSDTSSRRYFLRSLNKEHSGGLSLDPILAEKSGRGRKTLISKAQKKAKIDLLVGKWVSIERALRGR